MFKTRIISCILSATLTITSVFSTLGFLNLKASAEKASADDRAETTIEANQNSNGESYCTSGNGSYVSMSEGTKHFLPDENVSVSFSVNSTDSISDFTYTQSGFEVIAANVSSENQKQISLVLDCEENAENHELSLWLTLSSDEVVSAKLFAYQNEYGCFISNSSTEDAKERYFEYAIEEGVLTEDECQKIRMEYWQQSVTEEIVITPATAAANQRTSESSSNTEATTVTGSLSWKDDNNVIHNLRKVKVQIYKVTESENVLLSTVYSDDLGCFSATLTDLDANANNIFFKILTTDDNILVKQANLVNPYSYESATSENVTSGSNVSFSFTVDMSTILGQAFQVLQAVITARDYLVEMMDDETFTPVNVRVYYPHGSTNGATYECWTAKELEYGIIRLTGTLAEEGFVNPYAAWDAIMHEYGHHAQAHIGIPLVTNYYHNSLYNDADYYNDKDVGVRLAWSESWPTIFGLMAQDYYSNYLTNVETTCNGSYESNIFNDEIETNSVRLGEAGEGSVIAVLWDLYDSTPDEAYDSVALGHTGFWDISTVSPTDTFSAFMANFYAHTDYDHAVAPNLTYHKMASSAPVLSSDSAPTLDVAPTFEWIAQGGSVNFPNNSFVAVFYNSIGEEIFRTTALTSTSYSLTDSEWNNVLYSYGTSYSVAILASSTALPLTGAYLSASTVFDKPEFENLTQNMSVTADGKLHEEFTTLLPGQYVDITVSFEFGASMLIQTFGAGDTYIQLYNDLGTLITSNDNNGYLSNALVYRYCSPSFDYILRVKFKDENMGGSIKIAIAAANGPTSNITKYESIRSYENADGFTYSGYVSKNYMRAIVFTPTESGTFSISISGEVNMSVYLVDPESSTSVALFADGAAPSLVAELTAGVQYFIIFSASLPSQLTENADLTLTVARTTEE